MAIRYLSFDFDGCLFNRAYVELPHNNYSKDQTDAVLVKNRELLNKLKSENTKFSAVYGFIGSARQDYFTDMLNSGIYTPKQYRGSCCPAMATICDYLGITFDPLLLADIDGELASGTSYQRIMDEINNGTWSDNNKNTHQHAICAGNDEYKRTILFAQMQKAADDHPGEEIIFDFFDDRTDILWTLKEYFSEHNHMIPKNVQLRLHSYAGEKDKLIASIQGIGNPISNYQFCLRTMHENVKYLHEVAEALKEVTLQPRPEEKIFSIMKELGKKGLFINSAQEVNAFFAQNPDADFVVHPSSQKSDDLLLFNTSYRTSKNIVSTRYGFDLDGNLFLLDKGERFAIEMDPQGLIATLATHVANARIYIENNDNWNNPVPQPAQEQPEAMSKGQSLYLELTNSPYFVGFRASRFGLTPEGQLFSLDDIAAYKIREASEDLLGFLKDRILIETARVNQAEDLEKITFRGSQIPAGTTGAAAQTNRAVASQTGLFAHKAVAKPPAEPVLGHDMQP
ncbi:hypothetical protein OQJ13_06270 [Legionella sp. PATHC035]|uniref:hypothetical protein n=1 Tax=Legionella sp. PATHC035 TaxID=2992040 RepID=UPI002243E2D3|nr:hypothetical protein [Legionella sp. PATHC035]MCW8408577.1 hypothetical protein [Legionella sp. PATHC035]